MEKKGKKLGEYFESDLKIESGIKALKVRPSPTLIPLIDKGLESLMF